MGIIPDELKIQTFPCPGCGQFISSEVVVCKFCGTEITGDIRAAAILRENKERKKIFLGNQKQTIIIGAVFLGAGLFNIIFHTFDLYVHTMGSRIPCISPIVIIFGLVITIYGVLGYYREKKS